MKPLARELAGVGSHRDETMSRSDSENHRKYFCDRRQESRESEF